MEHIPVKTWSLILVWAGKVQDQDIKQLCRGRVRCMRGFPGSVQKRPGHAAAYGKLKSLRTYSQEVVQVICQFHGC